jgi:hypothetical protein
VTAVADDREQQLAWEERQRPRAGAAAIVAAVLLLGGFLWWVTLLRDAPQAGFLESLSRLGDGPIGEQPSIQVVAMQYTVDHTFGLVLSGLLRGLAPVALAYAVTFLAVAIRARRPEFPRAAVYMTIVGAVLYLLGTAGAEIDRTIAFNSFLDGPRTVDDARDVISSATITVALLAYVGQFIVAAGMLLVSLNAMRVGLLTRFMGILGVIVGVAVAPILPIDQQGIIRVFWLAALGLLFLGRLPSGVPKAWTTGQAEPWPSQQQLREQREAARAERDAAGGEPEPRRERDRGKAPPPKAPSPRRPDPAAAGTEHSASKKKKKRKRRT